MAINARLLQAGGHIQRLGRSVARRYSAFLSEKGGGAAVEMALVATPFLGLLVAALQLGLVYLSESTLEVATEKTARFVLTGTTQTSGQTQQQFLTALCGNLPALLSCSNVMVDARVYSSFSGSDTSTPTLTYDSNGNVTNQWSFNVGGPNDVVVLRVLYLLPVVGALNFNIVNQIGNKRLLMATAVFKNEPYQ
jgi:Flp pilus assembly protein TadG